MTPAEAKRLVQLAQTRARMDFEAEALKVAEEVLVSLVEVPVRTYPQRGRRGWGERRAQP